jgi:glc operon protein GlcG
MPFAAARRLTNIGAKRMMVAAIEKAEEIGIPITVAIVDAGGHIILLERMDGGRFHTIHSSTTKAVSASSNRRLTTTEGAQGQDLDTLHAIGLSLAAGVERWTAMVVLASAEAIGNKTKISPRRPLTQSAQKLRLNLRSLN